MLLISSSATLLFVGAVTAEASNSAGPVEQDAQAMQSADHIGPKTSIRQQIQDQLSKTGYTGVQIMPSSFLVRAKDKSGNPVEMIIGPDSFTEVTEVATKDALNANDGAVAPKTATNTPVTQAPEPKK